MYRFGPLIYGPFPRKGDMGRHGCLGPTPNKKREKCEKKKEIGKVG
jgi:hypothetical protein